MKSGVVEVVIGVCFFLPLTLTLFANGKAPKTSGILIRDIGGRQMFGGIPYYMKANKEVKEQLEGGMKLVKTGKSTCPNTLVQDPSKDVDGIPMHLFIPVISVGLFQEGLPMFIETTSRPGCANSYTMEINSSRWSVFEDKSLKKTFVGVGGPHGHPGLQSYNGSFHIETIGDTYEAYTLVFCYEASHYQNCSSIGTYDGEGGKRLVLTQDTDPNLFYVGFLNARPLISPPTLL